MCLDLTTTINITIIPDSTFRSDMSKALIDLEFSDVTFLVEGKSIYGHRAILSQQEYFRVMFSGNLRKSTQKEISINGIGHEVFEVIMHYAYTWEMKETAPDLVGEVLQATDLFMIEGLRHCCEAYLCNFITKDGVCQIFSHSYPCFCSNNAFLDVCNGRYFQMFVSKRRML